MIAAALTAMLLAPQTPAPDALTVEPVAVHAELERGERAFHYSNRSAHWQVLLFGTHELGLVRSLRVAPGADLDLPCNPAGFGELVLEIVSLTPEGLVGTGGIWLHSLDWVEHGRAVVTEGPEGLTTWVAAEGEGLVADTSNTFLGQAQGGGANGSVVIQSPGTLDLHVPVITPRPAGNNNPIKRTPLPPA